MTEAGHGDRAIATYRDQRGFPVLIVAVAVGLYSAWRISTQQSWTETTTLLVSSYAICGVIATAALWFSRPRMVVSSSGVQPAGQRLYAWDEIRGFSFEVVSLREEGVLNLRHESRIELPWIRSRELIAKLNSRLTSHVRSAREAPTWIEGPTYGASAETAGFPDAPSVKPSAISSGLGPCLALVTATLVLFALASSTLVPAPGPSPSEGAGPSTEPAPSSDLSIRWQRPFVPPFSPILPTATTQGLFFLEGRSIVAGFESTYLTHLSPDGTLAWTTKVLDSPTNVQSISVTAGSSGTLVMYSKLVGTRLAPGELDLVAYDTNGRRTGSTKLQRPGIVGYLPTTMGSGYVVLEGKTNASQSLVKNVRLVRISSDGSIESSFPVGAPGEDLWGLAAGGGALYVIRQINSDAEPSKIETRVLRYDTAGKVVWQRRFQGALVGAEALASGALYDLSRGYSGDPDVLRIFNASGKMTTRASVAPPPGGLSNMVTDGTTVLLLGSLGENGGNGYLTTMKPIGAGGQTGPPSTVLSTGEYPRFTFAKGALYMLDTSLNGYGRPLAVRFQPPSS